LRVRNASSPDHGLSQAGRRNSQRFWRAGGFVCSQQRKNRQKVRRNLKE
jgi:hypothetical protein